MKLKCPNCQSLLQVHDASAGKVVACRCGKRLRAPGDQTASGAGGKRPGGAVKASPRSPLSRRAAAGDIDAGLFDELTEADWKPVGAVPRPGAAPAPVANTSDKLLQQYGVTGASNGRSIIAGKRPGLLTFIGVVNGFWAVLMFLASLAIFGLVAAIPVVAPEVPAEGSHLLMIAGGILVFLFVLNVITAVSCFVGTPACWFVVLFSYAFSIGDRATGLVTELRAGAETSALVKAGIGMIVGCLFFMYLHQDEVRRYYRIEASRLKKAAIPDVLGLLVGLSLGTLAAFLA